MQIGTTLATTSIISYLVAMALEAWRPGFVTYFWNPQILLITAIVGIILACFGSKLKISRAKSFAFFIIFVILGTVLVFNSFPPSITKSLIVVGTVLLIVGMFGVLRHKGIKNI